MLSITIYPSAGSFLDGEPATGTLSAGDKERVTGKPGRKRGATQLVRRVHCAPEPEMMATGSQWRDAQGRSLQWLTWMGMHEEAAQVRASHSSKRPRERAAVRTNIHADKGKEQSEELAGAASSTSVEREHGHMQDADFSPPCSPVDDFSAALGSLPWDGDLLHQPICMSYDVRSRTMTTPRDGWRHYQGYVESVVPSEPSQAESMYTCWFDDHTIDVVPESLLRQCVICRSDIDTSQLLPVTPEALHVVAACKAAFGSASMPPCVRDVTDGTSKSCALVVFDTKSVAVNQWERAVTVLDDHAASLVQFVLGSEAHGCVSRPICSSCHSEAQWRTCVLSGKTARSSGAPACKHVLAVRHMWRTLHRCPGTPDIQVDHDIASSVRRDMLHVETTTGDVNANAKRHDDPGNPFPRLLPTLATCFFLLAQVCSRCVCHSLHRHTMCAHLSLSARPCPSRMSSRSTDPRTWGR